MKLDTVRIVAAEAPGGFVVVNRSDFDEQRHRLWPDTTEAVEPDHEPEKGKPVKAEGPEKSALETPEEPRLDDMSVTELREYAKAHGLELPAGTVAKAVLVDMIRAARNKAGVKSEGKSEDKGVEKTA